MEFLTYLVELLKTDPASFIGVIASLAGSLSIGGFSVWGIVKAVVAIINKIRGKNLKTTLSDIVGNKITPLLADINGFKQVIEQSVSNTLQNIQSQFGGELTALNGKLQELLAQSTALAGTVLNTSDLQLKYENLQKEFLLLKDKAQVAVVETGEILKAEVDAVVEEIKPEIEEIKTEVKKLKLKRKWLWDFLSGCGDKLKNLEKPLQQELFYFWVFCSHG